jgi:hypothetical protein
VYSFYESLDRRGSTRIVTNTLNLLERFNEINNMYTRAVSDNFPNKGSYSHYLSYANSLEGVNKKLEDLKKRLNSAGLQETDLYTRVLSLGCVIDGELIFYLTECYRVKAINYPLIPISPLMHISSLMHISPLIHISPTESDLFGVYYTQLREINKHSYDHVIYHSLIDKLFNPVFEADFNHIAAWTSGVVRFKQKVETARRKVSLN